MLARALIIVDNAELERRLDRVFEPLETAVATAPQQAVLWDRVKAFPAWEQTYFMHQLDKTKGNVDETARRAEINPRSLNDLMKRHGLKKEEFK